MIKMTWKGGKNNKNRIDIPVIYFFVSFHLIYPYLTGIYMDNKKRFVDKWNETKQWNEMEPVHTHSESVCHRWLTFFFVFIYINYKHTVRKKTGDQIITKKKV